MHLIEFCFVRVAVAAPCLKIDSKKFSGLQQRVFIFLPVPFVTIRIDSYFIVAVVQIMKAEDD